MQAYKNFKKGWKGKKVKFLEINSTYLYTMYNVNSWVNFWEFYYLPFFTFCTYGPLAKKNSSKVQAILKYVPFEVLK